MDGNVLFHLHRLAKLSADILHSPPAPRTFDGWTRYYRSQLLEAGLVRSANHVDQRKLEVDFLQESLHPDSRGDSDPAGARDWAENSTWHGLQVLATEAGGSADDAGTVEFIASYTYDGQDKQYREVAEFERVERRWYFRAGRPAVKQPIVRDEPKIGRNDACPCGSGRKYKRCCGA